MTLEVWEMIGKNKSVRTYKPSDKLVLPYCNLGVEIELENFTKGIPAVSPLWNITDDGSLRNHGYEFRFQEPLFGEDVTSALEDIEEKMSSQKPLPECSKRTSVHVHLDVRDLTGQQLINLIVVYFIFEKAIVAYHKNVREDNNFCLPYYKATHKLSHISSIFSSIKSKDKNIRNLLGDMDKYNAFNLKAVSDKGTIEFRHMPGSYNAEAIIEWINIILCLKKYAMNNEHEVVEIAEKMSADGPINFLYDVFGKELGNKLLCDNLARGMYDGVRLIQDAIHMKDFGSSDDSFFNVKEKKFSSLMEKVITDKEYAESMLNEMYSGE